LNWEDSKVALVVGLDIPEMVYILKLAEYLASTMTYNVVLEVWEYARFPHCTSGDDISMETRDIVDIID
jgi:hypothetical protein